MSTIIKLKDLISIVDGIDVIGAMREGFIQYSNGNSVVPPVGELIFEDPPGDVHIKYGYIKHQDYYVIKIASGFYNNTKLGIPSGQGLMLLFKQQTGQLEAVLLDEGYLTNVRTVAAASLAAQYFAPRNIQAAGIIGTGTIAKLQIQELVKTNYCESIWLWGRNQDKARQLRAEFGDSFDIHVATSSAHLAQNANVIFTTTPAESPLLFADDVQEGTLIIAVGSDTEHKQELDADILKAAGLVIADSIPQSKSRGEIYQGVKAGVISEDKVKELGNVLQDINWRKSAGEQSIVVDLTGVAVQDIMIASAVFSNFKRKN